LDEYAAALFQLHSYTVDTLEVGNQDQSDDRKWVHAHRILAYEGDTTISSRRSSSVVSFVEYMTTPSLPRPSHDIDTLEKMDIADNSNVKITRLSNGEYLIRGKTAEVEEDGDWILVVSDVATALQCARAGWGPKKLDVVQEL